MICFFGSLAVAAIPEGFRYGYCSFDLGVQRMIRKVIIRRFTVKP